MCLVINIRLNGFYSDRNMEVIFMRNKKVLTALVLAALCASPLTAQADDLPGYFDWRREVTTDRNSALTNSIVPAIRAQGKHETCWTFATLRM